MSELSAGFKSRCTSFSLAWNGFQNTSPKCSLEVKLHANCQQFELLFLWISSRFFLLCPTALWDRAGGDGVELAWCFSGQVLATTHSSWAYIFSVFLEQEREAGPDGLFLSQASVYSESSVGGARRGSACGSHAVRHNPCSLLPFPVWCTTLGVFAGVVPAAGDDWSDHHREETLSCLSFPLS